MADSDGRHAHQDLAGSGLRDVDLSTLTFAGLADDGSFIIGLLRKS